MPGDNLTKHGNVELGVAGVTSIVDGLSIVADRTRTYTMNGGTFEVRMLTDFNPVPPVNVAVTDVPNFAAGFGIVPGVDFPGTRKYEFTLQITAANAVGVAAGIATLGVICAPVGTTGASELAWMFGVKKMFVLGRFRSFEVGEAKFRGAGNSAWARVKVRFETITPWIYDCLLRSLPAAGVVFGTGYAATRPFSMPLAPGVYSAQPSFTLVGPGEPLWTARITGPITNPVIVEDITAQVLAFGHSTSSVVLTSGQTIDIDSVRDVIRRNAPTVDPTYKRLVAAGSTVYPRFAVDWNNPSNGIRPVLVGQTGGTGTWQLDYYAAYYGMVV